MGYVLEGDDKSHKIGRYYLDSNEWDLQKASDNYKSDLKFE